MNKFIMTGRLAKDPELKTLQSGTEVCNFTVAVDRRFKKDGQPTADFFNTIAFGKTANFVNTYFTKGKMICVEGNLQNRNWEDQNGQKHYVTEVLVDNVEFCGDKVSSDNKNNAPTQNYSNPQVNEQDSDDELPF